MDFPALGSSSAIGSGSGAALPQGLAASMGMNSSSSMSDPLGWMGPSDAKNAGKPLCYQMEVALLISNPSRLLLVQDSTGTPKFLSQWC